MRLLLISLSVVLQFSAFAQLEPDPNPGLELFHREKRITKFIPLGTKVVLSLGDQRHKGILESIGELALTVDGVDYEYQEITWIGVSTKWTKSLAVGIGVVGLGIATAGAIYVAAASGAGFVSTALIVAGGVGMTSVAIPLFKHGKRFYLDSDWKVKPPLN